MVSIGFATGCALMVVVASGGRATILAAPLALWTSVVSLPGVGRTSDRQRVEGGHAFYERPVPSARVLRWPLWGAIAFWGASIAMLLQLEPSGGASAEKDVGLAMARATTLFEGGQLKEALEAFNAIKIPACYPRRRVQRSHNIGVILLRLGRTDEAIDALRSALTYDPADTAARNLLERIESGSI